MDGLRIAPFLGELQRATFQGQKTLVFTARALADLLRWPQKVPLTKEYLVAFIPDGIDITVEYGIYCFSCSRAIDALKKHHAAVSIKLFFLALQGRYEFERRENIERWG
jgi:hypothetical protein